MVEDDKQPLTILDSWGWHINYQKLSGLKQEKCILSQFWRPEPKIKVGQGSTVSGALEENLSLLSASRRCCPSSASASWPRHSISAVTFSLRRLPLQILLLLLSFSHSVVSDSWTPWTITHQAPLSMGFSSQEYWSGLPCLPPGVTPGIEPTFSALAEGFFTSAPHRKTQTHVCVCVCVCIWLNHFAVHLKLIHTVSQVYFNVK